MKALSLALLFVSLAPFTRAQACPDLSGTYEFAGLNKETCHGIRVKTQNLWPIPYSTILNPGQTFTLEQNNCESLRVSFVDPRFSNSSPTTYVISINENSFHENVLKSVTKNLDVAFNFKRELVAYASREAWSLELTDASTLTMKHNFRSLAPSVNFVMGTCNFKKVK